MTNNLFPIQENENIFPILDMEKKIGYRSGINFDFQISGSQQIIVQKIQDIDGIASWENWCKICLATERYEHLAYSSDFGIETKEAFLADTKEKAESILTRQIKEALKADPYGRTDYVEDVSFLWATPDSVQVTVIVHGINQVTITISEKIRR